MKYLHTIIILASLMTIMIVSCKKKPELPVIDNKIEIGQTTINISTDNSAQVTTNVTNLGGNNISQHGHCWSLNQNPTITDSKTTNGILAQAGSYSSEIALSNLSLSTTYYVRPYLTYSNGILYGSQKTFTTLSVPILSTTTISAINSTSASGGGNITSDGGASVTTRGLCWNTSGNPTISNSKTTDGTGIGAFTSNMTGLTNNTIYYVRAYATNVVGTSYGNEVAFDFNMNVPGPSVTDIDGNIYKTVKIGSQVWMAENLMVTKYQNGDAIPNISDGPTWASLTSGAYCDFVNNAANGAIYGHLYNFYSVVDNRQLCPTGWHIPTDNEWMTLRDYLGGEDIAGGKLKEVGTSHWNSPNNGADNSSGFTAIGGSWRGKEYSFYYNVGHAGWFWTSTSSSSNDAWFYHVRSGDALLVRISTNPYFDKRAGLSVRCIKD